MNTTKIVASALSLATAATLLVGALPAAAQTIDTSSDVAVSASVPSTAINNPSITLAAAMAIGHQETAARITSLTNLNVRVQSLKNVSAIEKMTIESEVQSNISGLTQLQQKIDTDTTVKEIRTDYRSIFTDFRVYLLVVPQTNALVSADRMNTLVGSMTASSTELQARINAAQAGGKDVSSLLVTIGDMNAKIEDAASQSSAIVSGVATLMPDMGNMTVAASNKVALDAAQVKVGLGNTDLTTAFSDMKTIQQGLKALGY